MTRKRDLLPAVLFAGYGVFEVLSGVAPGVGEVPGEESVSAVAAALAGAALAFRRRKPVVGLAVAVAAQLIESLVTTPAEGLAPLLCGLILAYAVASRCSQRVAVAGLLGAVGALGLAVGDPVFVGVIFAVPWLAGRILGERQRQLINLQVSSVADADRGVWEERARIARDLHDIVSHALSLVVVQAQVAQAAVRTDPDAAERSLLAVKEAGQQALADMRRLLGVLRVDESVDGPRTPQPGMAELPMLLDRVRAAGLEVEMREEGLARQLAPGASLTAFRIIQEGLTNVLRHAGPARVTVTLGWSSTTLSLGVVDDGPGGREQPGTGRGLLGLKERVAVYGGTLRAGRAVDGGFELEAVLPT